MLQLHRENTELDRLLSDFRNNNGVYLKIRFVAKQKVKSALSDKRLLLKLALHSLMESWRANPTKFNFLIHGMPTVSAISRPSVMNHQASSNYPAPHFSSYYSQNNYTENLTEIIVNGVASLYEKMVEDFANETMANAASSTDSNPAPRDPANE